jgi:hypothetical protein
MKIALCFSGQIRDLNETKSFWKDFIKKYNIDVYASFWDTERPDLGDTVLQFERIYTPKRLEIENYDDFKETTQSLGSMYIQSPESLGEFVENVSKPLSQLPMYYKIWRANLLTKQLGIEYDLVIRARTDVVLDERFELENNNYLNVPMGRVQNYVLINNYGINDCFAYGKPKIMDYYSFIYLQIMQYLKEGHYAFPPEHLLSVHFSKIRIQIREFPNYMVITRVSKGLPHEVYNNFVTQPEETIFWSDEVEFSTEPIGNFMKKDIKDDFIV